MKAFIIFIINIFIYSVYGNIKVNTEKTEINSENPDKITNYWSFQDMTGFSQKLNMKSVNEKSVLDSIVIFGILEDSIREGKKIFYYDDNGKILKSDDFTYNQIIIYVYYWNDIEYIYNSDGSIQQIIGIQEMIAPEEMINLISNPEQHISTYHYNIDGSISKIRKVSENHWLYGLEKKEEFQYGQNGNLLNYSLSYLSFYEEEVWDTIIKEKYTYFDSTEYIKIKTTYGWDTLKLQWDYKLKSIQTLNNNGQRIKWIDYKWHKAKNQWGEFFKEEIIYGNNNEILMKTASSYDTIIHQWNGVRKKEYIYNSTGNISKINFYDMGYFTHEWEIDEKWYYYYSYINITGIADQKITSAIKLYPNPAEDQIFISSDLNCSLTYRIINSCGIIYKKGNINDSGIQQIDISNLPKGIYFIEIIGNNNFRSFLKFIKQ